MYIYSYIQYEPGFMQGQQMIGLVGEDRHELL